MGNTLISLQDNNSISDIKIYNATGQLMIRQLVDNNIFELNTASLSNGIYLIKLADDDGNMYIDRLLVHH